MGRGSSLGPKDYEKRSKLSQIKQGASSYKGSHEWLQSRMLASFSAILSIYVIIALLTGKANSYESFLLWLTNPFNAVVLILTILTFIGHGVLGLITVINDYVHNFGVKFFVIWLIRGFFGFIAFLSVASILYAVLLSK